MTTPEASALSIAPMRDEHADAVLGIYAAGIATGTASLALHEKLGFRVVGTRERLGLMTHGPLAGEWLDVVLLEKRL